MKLCLDDSNCINNGRCFSGVCVCTNEYFTDQHHEIRNHALTLPIVGAILDDIPSLRHFYLFIFIFLAAIGLVSNIFSLVTCIRDRIRYTVCGVYLIMFSVCAIIMMTLFLTNIIIAAQYDNYLLRLWACHGYPYLFLVIINISILITAVIAIENLLNRYFSVDRFRSRKCALFVLCSLSILVLISNLDKIFARNLKLDRSGRLYCTYEYPLQQFWFYMNNSTFYFYMVIPCIIHSICIIYMFSKIKQQKQKWYRKIFIYMDHILPSFVIIQCLCIYAIFQYLFDSCIIYSDRFYIHFRIGLLLILYIPQIFTFFIYILPNKYYLREFQQSWICQRFFCCCSANKQRQIQEFPVIHKLWQRRTSLETVMTISSLNDYFVNSEFYKSIKLEL
ncbi:unnamed protein product [Rotaria sp. Silwood2]|nr:unnamed protein product [Rotaria sp. Silwood2]CAF3045732.1 unnamed protein product [Rotaria sp. Silwood2]CAF4126684.1 unnamed protein product [Rotaria sp. Silwood2]CAF4232238.1 unnamed protein product [Rotaria sp. Silwood2]